MDINNALLEIDGLVSIRILWEQTELYNLVLVIAMTCQKSSCLIEPLVLQFGNL